MSVTPVTGWDGFWIALGLILLGSMLDKTATKIWNAHVALTYRRDRERRGTGGTP